MAPEPAPEPEQASPGWFGKRAPAAQWTGLIALSAGISAFLLWLHAPAALLLIFAKCRFV